MRGEGAAPFVAVGELTTRVARLLATTQTLEAAAQIVIDEVCDTMGYEIGHLYYLDRTHETLTSSNIWHAADALRMKPFIDATTSLPISDRFLGRATRYSEPVIIQDVRTDADFDRRWLARGARLRGGLAFPIASGRDVYGVIEFFDDREANPIAETVEAIQACVTLIGLIAEQERARRELAADQIRILLEATSEPVIAADGTSCVIGINQPAEKLFGWHKDEIIGRSLFETVIRPSSAALTREAAMKLFANGEEPAGESFETIGQNRAGAWFPMRVTLWSTFVDGERIVYGFISDLDSAESPADEAVRVAERRLHDTLRRVGMATWEIDLHTGEVKISDEALALIGYQPGELDTSMEGMMQHVLVSDTDMVRELIDHTLTKGRTVEYETRVLRSDGMPVWVRVLVETEYDRHHQPVRLFGTCCDVTDMRGEGDKPWYRVVGERHEPAVQMLPLRPMGTIEAEEQDIPKLTQREREILMLLREGLDVTKIAKALEISIHTARDHLKRIRSKLGVQSQLQAVVRAASLGILDPV